MSLLDSTRDDRTTHDFPSLECPTMVKGTSETPSMAIVEHLSSTTCRLRSVAHFDEGDLLTFTLTVQGAPQITLTGRVTEHATSGPRTLYNLQLEQNGDTREDELARVVREAIHRRSLSRLSPDVPTENGLTRAGVRVPVDVAVRYETAEHATGTAQATNISAGGLLITSPDDLPIGSALALSFWLNGAVHDAHVSISARIVAQQMNADGFHSYNLAFFGADAATRAAIDAYIKTRLQ